MSQGIEYFCTLKPVEPYFLGGERNFVFDEQPTDKVDYYLTSEDIPQQSTIVGLLRYLMLAKAGLLSDTYYGADQERQQKVRADNAAIRSQQTELIGSQGFFYEADKPRQDYGKLYEVSPLFLLNAEGHRMVRTPLNHVTGQKAYQPFAMESGFVTEKNVETILPVNFTAKDWLTDSFVDLDTAEHNLTERDDIFQSQEHTRIGRGEEEKGYFKQVYKYLTEGYKFGFYCRAEAGALPETDIVYLGQGKSAFHFTAVATDGGKQAEFFGKIQSLPGCDKADVYYAVSDLFLNLTAEENAQFAYTIIEKKQFRTLNSTAEAECYRASRKKSALFQLIRAGSVFYLPKGHADVLGSTLEQAGLQQAGFNHVEKLGGK